MSSPFEKYLSGKVVVLGIGNALRRDDAIGSVIAGSLKDTASFIVYDSGSSPENYLGKIIKDDPDNVIIIDAVDFKGKPGEFRVFKPDDFSSAGFFLTHNSSISLVINYLQKSLKANIIVLAIQPSTVTFGEGLSRELNEAFCMVRDIFYEADKKKR